MALRNYDPNRDREAAHRIWRECGWLKKGEEEWMDRWIGCGRALVAEVHGEAECLVLTAPGTVRYVDEDLPLCAVTGVTTSRVARKQGLAGRLTAKAVALAAAEGALVAGLGMFEQGYYNQFGFGTGGYEHWMKFDPAHLVVPTRVRPPRRITEDDWQAAHAARLARKRGHGGVNLISPDVTRCEMHGTENGFGLGYYDGPDGELTHYLWCGTDNVESGPYNIGWMAYRTPEQFLELMAVIHSWGDQIHLVRMLEPSGIQLQDLIRQPFKHRTITEKSRFEAAMHAPAYWQMRICDLEGCLARTHLRGEEARFNLRLHDPIARFLEEDAPWRGISGEYVVRLGPESNAERGADAALPTLTASVGAFTRLWLGVRPATGLAVTDELSGPPELLERLGWTLRLPDPKPDWDY